MSIKDQTGFSTGDTKRFENELIASEQRRNINQSRALLQFGPLAKNKYTIEVENLVKAFLSGDAVKYTWGTDHQGNKELIATISDKHTTTTINLSNALKYANFNHFSFSDADYSHYVDFLTKQGNFKRNDSRIKPETREGTLPTENYFQTREKQFKVISEATFAEKCAINIYTKQDEQKDKTSYYAIMNSFLRGDTSYFQKNSTNLSADCNELLAHLGMCISGLNKTPHQPLPEVAWREVPDMPEFVTLESIEARKTGKVTNHMGMVSTNKGRPKDMGTSAGGNYMMFKNVKGIDVSPYSKFGSPAGGAEREILMPPTQIAWTNHTAHLFNPTDKPTPIDAGLSESEKRARQLANAKKFVHFFIAEPVTTLTNMPDEALKLSIDAINNAASDRMEEQMILNIVKNPEAPQPAKPEVPTRKAIVKPSPSSPISAQHDNIFDLMTLKPIIEYTYQNHLSKRYTEPEVFASDFDLNTKKGRIERPNHGLPHTVRKTSYIPHLVKAFQDNMPEPNPYKSFTADDIRKMQAAMIFSVSGRESDTGFSLHNNSYGRYKQISADNFSAYFSPDGKGIFTSQSEINRYGLLVKLMCMPSAQAKVQLQVLPEAMREKHQNLLNVLTLCHELDEQRCWNGPAFQRVVMEPLTNLIGSKAALDLKALSFEELKATGNKIMVGRPQEYQQDLFYDCSTNVDYCMNIINQKSLNTNEVVPPPKATSRPAPITHHMPSQQSMTTKTQATRQPEIEKPPVLPKQKAPIPKALEVKAPKQNAPEEKPRRQPPPKRPVAVRLTEVPPGTAQKPTQPIPHSRTAQRQAQKPIQSEASPAPQTAGKQSAQEPQSWDQMKIQVEQLTPNDILSKNAVNNLIHFMDQKPKASSPQEARRQLEDLRDKVNDLIKNVRDPHTKTVLTDMLANTPARRAAPPPKKR